MRTRRALTLLLALLALAPMAMPRGAAASGGIPSELNVAMVCSPDLSMNPLSCVERDPQSIMGLVYESLISLDDRRVPQAMLAESWVEIGSGGVWEFTLREGVKFHNGKELTARDVVATLNAISELAIEGRGMFSQTAAMLSDWEAKSEYVVRVRAKQSGYPVLYVMTFPILPEGETKADCPPGTGPYRVDFYQPGNQMLMIANEAWWQRPSAIRMITARWFGTDADALTAFQLEQVDVLMTRSLQATRYRGVIGSTVTSLDYITRQLEVLMYNNSATVLKTPEMRQALSHAIDRSRIAQMVYQNVVTITDTIAMPTSSIYNADAKTYAYNPDAANRMLDALGYSARGADGFRVNADGESLILRLFYYDEQGSTLRHDAAFQIKDMLAQVGVNAKITYYIFDNGKAKLASGDFDLFLCGINFGIVPDPTFLLSTTSESNYARYRSKDIGESLKQLSRAPDETSFRDAWYDIQALMSNDMPLLPLYWRGGILLVRGVYLNARNLREYEVLRTLAESNR
ncbi:MAG: ABC transporter substrate-binding protein [Oscillospiraceae bacterium]|jgi:peptide/nickel transport system substrate-binding protein|nr:ABC transporter substrate-binding protein [Oscillospiraceae bacterium]